MHALRQLFPSNDFALLALVMLMPLLGAIVNGIFGKRLGKDGVRLMALSVMAVAFAGSLATFLNLALAGPNGDAILRVSWKAWSWFSITGRMRQEIPIDIIFSADALSATMMLIVTGIGFLIHLYSTGYMADDPGYHRFFAYLNLFIFSMMVLILGDNLAVLFVGWEGVGLCSYLLIGFWFDDEKKAAAGKKAFITNRIGDFGLLVAMAMLVYHVGDLSWSNLETASAGLGEVQLWPIFDLRQSILPDFAINFLMPAEPVTASVATVVALALFVGCAGKSAQVPLYVWLPDAMAGPTPVSALIHAATMVTAGVYLVARCSFLFVMSPVAMAVVAGVGAFTALLAASVAFAQTDLKKVLAYSTVSQLGFMFIGVGVGAFGAGFFHVITHAFFKGCLFLCAGSVIHAMHAQIHDEEASQDMRKMGGLRKYMPITHATFLVSCLAIAGFPLFSGFWSKDEILFKAFSNQIIGGEGAAFWSWYGQLIYAVGAVAALGTAFYMFRAYFLTFWGDFRGWKIVKGLAAKAHDHDHHDDGPLEGAEPLESPWSMTLPLVVLATFAAFGGYLYAEPIHVAPLHHFWEPVFRTASAYVEQRPGTEALMWPMMGVGAAIFAVGVGAAYFVYVVKAGAPAASFVSAFPRLHRLVYDKWRVDELYDLTVLGLVDAMGEEAARLDKVVVDGVLAKLTAAIASGLGQALSFVQTGRVQVYAAAMVIGTTWVGWYVVAPHADAHLDDSALQAAGTLKLKAAPGHGYRYKWHVEGGEPPAKFSSEAEYSVALDKCELKIVHLEVQNSFGWTASETFSTCRRSSPHPRCCAIKSPAETGDTGRTSQLSPAPQGDPR